VQSLPWVQVAPGVPYFQTEDGSAWHPVGANEAISWPELNPLFRRRDVAAVEAYLEELAAQGVTCLRLMLEYAQGRHRYFEHSPGRWSPNMVQLWDDLFSMCERHGLRILLTPFDTFWMWLKFHHHPYSQKRGGPLDHPSRLLLCKETRVAIRDRLTFAAERWGGSGALFAWDLWNEIHPAHAQETADPFEEFIEDLSSHLRAVEMRCFGRTHPQTVSIYGPELTWKPHLAMEPHIYRHTALDFATIHMYEHGTIDDPKNTVDSAIGMGRLVQKSLAEILDTRPFFDSEHGPIHSFKDKHRTLPEPFDDEYFRHMQWAHLASGGAGGGMRWPNRKPHSLTAGMRRAQRSLSDFLPCLDWLRFARHNVTDGIVLLDAEGLMVAPDRVARFGCASKDQAVVYLLRRDTLLQNDRKRKGHVNAAASPLSIHMHVPLLQPGSYRVRAWDTASGTVLQDSVQAIGTDGRLCLPPFVADVALAIRTG
jgi:mannan endo-1,4-beta-mannosidase